MVDVLIYYGIWALATGLFSVYNIYWPVLKLIKLSEDEDHAFLTSPIVSIVIFILAATILAPLFLSSIVSMNARDEFIQGFYEGSNE